MLKTICFTLFASIAGSAVAQNSARSDPANPKLVVPVRPYESVFTGYRPYVDAKVARWRETNEEMGRLGGHLGDVPKSSDETNKPAANAPATVGWSM